MGNVEDYVENAMKTLIKDIAIKKNVTLDTETQEAKQVKTETTAKYVQTIFYGVPGCGKSYCIDGKLKELGIIDKEEQTKRVVFHPEYTNSDFIGQILPKVEGENKIKYEFTPGPFTEILKKAYENKNTPYALIIEEINRGNASAIFGELFQLLDRFDLEDEPETMSEITYSTGWSAYCVNNDNINSYIRDKYNDTNAFIPKELFDKYKLNIGIRLPPNLSLFATMNTSDQNVFKLDNAFKRRWDLELIPNEFDFTCDDEDAQKKQIIQCNALIDGFDFSWGAFRNAVNEIIIDPENGEDNTSFSDKQIGTWFVKANEDGIISTKIFANKVLEYLWDDVFSDDPSIIFNSKYKSLAQLIRDINKDETDEIFKEEFLQKVGLEKVKLDELQKNTCMKTKEELNPAMHHVMTPYLEEVQKMVKVVSEDYNLNLTCKQYIGVIKDKESYGENFVFFKTKPRVNEFRFGFLLKTTQTLESDLKTQFGEKVTVEVASKEKSRCMIPLKFDDFKELAEKKESLLALMKKAYEDYTN